MIIRILESAKKDLKKGFHFYDKQPAGLGDYFLDSIFSDIDSLIIYHNIHPVRFEIYHCMFAKRFPYAIYYSTEGREIFVDAILDCRQNPYTVQKRLKTKD